jgi:hypothetical protein
MSYEISIEKIEENYNKFLTIINVLPEERKIPILNMLEVIGERLAICPGSSKVEYHACYPGGLVEHSIRVFQFAHSLEKLYKFGNIPRDSIIICSLFHDLGKLGDVDNEFYVPTTERWQIEKGHLYEYNKKITYMNTSLRSLFLLHHFGIKLTQDEYLAIYLHDGQYIDKNKDYSLKEPNLSLIIHQADVAAAVWEKQNLK